MMHRNLTDVFASRVADGLAQRELANLVAGEIADEVIGFRKDLIAYRPILVGALERVVASEPFRAVARRAVRQAHQTVLSETGENLVLTAADLKVVVNDALAMYPQIADKLPPEAMETIGAAHSWQPGKNLARVKQVAQRMRNRAIVLLLVGLGTGIAGFALARRKDRYLMRCGIWTAGAALVVGVAAQFGAPLVARAVDPGVLELMR